MAFIGEIQLFSFGYAPPGWVHCDGRELAISRFTGLYSLIDTTYGGDGKIKFRVPNLTGRAACGQGQGTGLSRRKTGDTFGVNQVALAVEQAPAHSHGLTFFNILKTTDPVSGREIDNRADKPAEGYSLAIPDSLIFVKVDTDSKMTNTISALAGGTDVHENRQPFGALEYYILTQNVIGDDVFPSFD